MWSLADTLAHEQFNPIDLWRAIDGWSRSAGPRNRSPSLWRFRPPDQEAAPARQHLPAMLDQMAKDNMPRQHDNISY